jgi:hypothetical protein
MNRRAFFSLLSAGVAAAADPERLLWTPGRKLISIPRLVVRDPTTYAQCVEANRILDKYNCGYPITIKVWSQWVYSEHNFLCE